MSRPPVFTNRCCKLGARPLPRSAQAARAVAKAGLACGLCMGSLERRRAAPDIPELRDGCSASAAHRGKARRRIELNPHFVGSKRFRQNPARGPALAGMLAVFAEFRT